MAAAGAVLQPLHAINLLSLLLCFVLHVQLLLPQCAITAVAGCQEQLQQLSTASCTVYRAVQTVEGRG
jgi:hypothetical protein